MILYGGGQHFSSQLCVAFFALRRAPFVIYCPRRRLLRLAFFAPYYYCCSDLAPQSSSSCHRPGFQPQCCRPLNHAGWLAGRVSPPRELLAAPRRMAQSAARCSQPSPDTNRGRRPRPLAPSALPGGQAAAPPQHSALERLANDAGDGLLEAVAVLAPLLLRWHRCGAAVLQRRVRSSGKSITFWWEVCVSVLPGDSSDVGEPAAGSRRGVDVRRRLVVRRGEHRDDGYEDSLNLDRCR